MQSHHLFQLGTLWHNYPAIFFDKFKIADERYTIQNEKLEQFKIADERYAIQYEKLEVLMQKILNIDDKYEKRFKYR